MNSSSSSMPATAPSPSATRRLDRVARELAGAVRRPRRLETQDWVADELRLLERVFRLRFVPLTALTLTRLVEPRGEPVREVRLLLERDERAPESLLELRRLRGDVCLRRVRVPDAAAKAH